LPGSYVKRRRYLSIKQIKPGTAHSFTHLSFERSCGAVFTAQYLSARDLPARYLSTK
jgi:hypothetical protein